MQELLTTIIARPYVFAFLAAYLLLAIPFFGARRTLVWLLLGYGIAWASELSSIHNGFPYGEYHYLYENMPGELMIFGVPFFDSLSYAFLTFSGFTMASCMRGKMRSATASIGTVLLGALLTMMLDVIIDPIATMGERWFLGQIHFYAHPGRYFGIPLTNFAGWFLVAFSIIACNALLWKSFPQALPTAEKVRENTRTNLLYPAFYAGIALFNIAITFWIGEWALGLMSSVILAGILGIALASHLKRAP